MSNKPKFKLLRAGEPLAVVEFGFNNDPKLEAADDVVAGCGADKLKPPAIIIRKRTIFKIISKLPIVEICVNMDERVSKILLAYL